MEDASNASFLARGACSLPTSPYIVEPSAAKVARLSVEVGAALIGVLGNILVCVIVTKRKHLRPADGFYIRSLAIADLGILLVNFPIAVMKEQSPLHWPIGRSSCYVLYPVSEVFHGASIWSIVAIAIERYRNIIYRSQQTKRSTKLSIASIWLGSFAIFVLPLLFIVRYDEVPCGTFCSFMWPRYMDTAYIILDVLLLYFVPLAVITFTYARITRELNESTSLHMNIALHWSVRYEDELEIIKQNARTKRLLNSLVTVFSITMLPLNAFRVVFLTWKGFHLHKLFLVFYNVCVLGVVLNSAADPIIYTIVTKGFIAKLSFVVAKRRASQSDAEIHKTLRESRV